MIPRRIFWLFDLITLGLAFFFAYLLFSYIQPLFTTDSILLPSSWLETLAPPTLAGQLPPISDLTWIFLVMTAAIFFSLELLGVYNNWFIKISYIRLIGGSMLASVIGLSLVALVMFALKSPGQSRIFVFSFALLTGLGLIAYRVGIRYYLHRRRMAGYYVQNVLVVGLPSGIEWLKKYFANNIPSTEHRLFGYLNVDSTPPTNGELSYLPCLGNVEDLGDLLIQQPIHEVIATQSHTNGWLEQVIRDCDHLGVLLRIVPEILGEKELYTLQPLSPSGPLPLPAIVLKPPYQDSDALFFKRVFDIVVSALLLLILSPLFLIIALAIKITTPHLSIFYPWRVVGRKGVEFTGYKFTTMGADADVVKNQLLQYNEMSGPVFKIKEDPRITSLGHYLRKYSLNELPQLWSVLKGDMSLVGPRPAFRHELEGYDFWHKRKLSVRPGMTCLWQVRGRNQISDFDEWVKMDLEYIDNWSLWLDFKILFQTFWAVVGGTGS